MGHCNGPVVGMAHHTDTKLRSETGEYQTTVVNWKHNVITVHF